MLDEGVGTVVEPLVRVFAEVENVILSGSRARGETRPDSDWDVVVTMPSALRPVARGGAIRRAARVPGIPMDFFVRTPQELREGFSLLRR